MKDFVVQALDQAQSSLSAFIDSESGMPRLSKAGELLAERMGQGARAFSCGNGGSMCDAMHFAEELSGRFRQDRRPLPATAIADPAHISCVANDFGYSEVFSRYIEAHGAKGDFFLAISTSGTSENVLRAVRVAKDKGLHVVGLTGRSDTPLEAACDITIVSPGPERWSDRVQEVHIKCIHIMIEAVERQLFPELYRS